MSSQRSLGVRLGTSVCLLVPFAATGCRLPMFSSDPSEVIARLGSEPDAKTIYVVGHGWHTGLVLRTRDIQPEILPEIRNYQHTEFVELGWGDEGFYTADKITPPLVVRAACWPTPSVLHVAGFRGDVERVFQASDIVEVRLNRDRFDRLCAFADDTFARGEADAPIPLGPGLYGDSTFYRANGTYYFPKTCNVWTARALHEAGCPITPQTSIAAESVIDRARDFGRVLQKSPKGLKRAALGGSR